MAFTESQLFPPTVPPRAPGPDTRQFKRIAAALAVFSLGLALTAAALGFLDPVFQPRRDTGMPDAKLAELAARAPEIDVLVLGTSRLLHGFDPAAFHEETSRLGRPLRAYNLSLQRLLLWEQERVLADALALPGLLPRVVVLEPAVGLGIAPENFTHARTLEFETAAAWRSAVQAVLDSSRSPLHQAWNITAHSLVAGLHQLRYGLYTNLAFPAPPAAAEIPALRDGFLALPDRATTAAPPPGLAELAASFRSDYAARTSAPGPLPEALQRHFRRLRALCEARGIAVVFVQPPQLAFTTDELRRLTFQFAPALAGDGGLLTYLDPAAHGPLFDLEGWADYNHMTATGARRFSAQLARDLAAATPGPAR